MGSPASRTTYSSAPPRNMQKNPRQPTPRGFFHFHSLNGASALNVFMKRNTNAARDRTPSFA